MVHTVQPPAEYSPAQLVLDVINLLDRNRIPAEVTDDNRLVAQIAAADLLRALQVTPAIAPTLGGGFLSGPMG